MNRTLDTMKQELEDALGETVSEDEARRAVERPVGRAAWLRENRLLVLITGSTAIVVGGILSLALDSVWLLVLALALHLIGTFVVATLSIKLLAEVDKPGPTTVASLEAAGVEDPEHRLNKAIRSHGSGRAARQSDAMTPSADGTVPAGPGSEESLRATG